MTATTSPRMAGGTEYTRAAEYWGERAKLHIDAGNIDEAYTCAHAAAHVGRIALELQQDGRR